MLTITTATAADLPLIQSLIHDLATYERLERLRDETSRTVYGIIRSVEPKLKQGVTRRRA